MKTPVDAALEWCRNGTRSPYTTYEIRMLMGLSLMTTQREVDRRAADILEQELRTLGSKQLTPRVEISLKPGARLS